MALPARAPFYAGEGKFLTDKMASEQLKMGWALVFFLGLIATYYLVSTQMLSDMWGAWVWFVLLLVGNWSIGKAYGKMPEGVKNIWMGVMVMFAVVAGTMLLGLWGGDISVMFALWLIFSGGAMFATGHEMKNSIWTGMGLMNLALGIVFPTWFGGTPYLAAALLIGLPMLLAAWKKM